MSAEEFADVSSHQAGTDLAAYVRRGHRRILLKATEGTTYTNTLFAAWWRAAGVLGVARGAYHFARPSSAVAAGRPVEAGGEAEAVRFAVALRSVGGLGARDWVCLDVEDPRERGPRAARHAVAFCFRMVELGFPWGMIYSYTPYLAGIGLRPGMLPGGWQQLHVANYGATPDARVPLPPGWGRELVVARQYSESARQAGIPGGSDANRVVREWLPALASAEAEEDDDVTEDQMAEIVRRVAAAVVTDPMGLRNQVGVVGAGVADVGDRVDFLYDQLARLAPSAGVTLDVPPWRAGG